MSSHGSSIGRSEAANIIISSLVLENYGYENSCKRGSDVRSAYLKVLHHRDKETECERERLSWLQSDVQMAVRFTQSTRLTWDGITPLFSFTRGFAWPLLFLCETILAKMFYASSFVLVKNSSHCNNILLNRIVIKTGQTGQSSGSPTLHRPGTRTHDLGGFYISYKYKIGERDSFKWTLEIHYLGNTLIHFNRLH